MQTLLIIIPVSVLIVISSFLTKAFKYKIEQAHFLTVVGITLFLIICGLIRTLLIGYYLIIAFAVFSVVYLIIKRFDIKSILSPGFCGYITLLSGYVFLSRGSLLFDHDDVVHWAYATKCMYYSDTFYKGLQAMFTPTFNYFITKTSLHFSETTLFTGSWIIIWSCFILPLKNFEWKDWKKVLAYFFASYCILGFLYGNVSLQIDQTMGYMAGVMIAYTAINKDKTIKDYVIIAAGLLAISQIKDSFGAVTSMLAALCVIIIEIVQNFGNLKKKYPMLIMFFIIPIAGYFISNMTIDKPAGYLPTESLWDLPVIELFLQSRLTQVIVAAAAICAVMLFVFIVKNNASLKFGKYKINLYIIFGVLFAIFAAGAFYKVSSLFLSTFTFTERAEFNDAWEDFFYHTYSGLTNKYLMGMIGVLFVGAAFYFIKKEKRKQHLVNVSAVYIAVIIYVMMVLVAFAAGFHRSGIYSESVSWERYLSTAMLMLLTYTIAYFFNSQDIYVDDKKHRLIAMSLVILITVRYLPYPGIIYNSKSEMTRYGPSGFVERYAEHSEIILNYVENDETVYIVSYEIEGVSEDKTYGYYPNIYIKYATAPILSNWMYSSYDLDSESETAFNNYIKELSEYDYIYIQSAGEDYYNVMGEFFPEGHRYSEKALYKVESTDEGVTLIPVYVDESCIIG